MAALGKSLIFYFKYWTEMHRLCGTEGDLEGLQEPEKTREMARAIGDKAQRQIADLLEACEPVIEGHFKSIGRCLRITTRKYIEKKWSLSFSIYPRNKPVKAKMMAGVSIIRQEKPELIPWVWCLGGEETEKKMEFYLCARAKVRSHEMDLNPGYIGLDRIPLLPEGIDSFDSDREPLLENVQQALQTFGHQDLGALWPK